MRTTTPTGRCETSSAQTTRTFTIGQAIASQYSGHMPVPPNLIQSPRRKQCRWHCCYRLGLQPTRTQVLTTGPAPLPSAMQLPCEPWWLLRVVVAYRHDSDKDSGVDWSSLSDVKSWSRTSVAWWPSLWYAVLHNLYGMPQDSSSRALSLPWNSPVPTAAHPQTFGNSRE